MEFCKCRRQKYHDVLKDGLTCAYCGSIVLDFAVVEYKKYLGLRVFNKI